MDYLKFLKDALSTYTAGCRRKALETEKLNLIGGRLALLFPKT